METDGIAVKTVVDALLKESFSGAKTTWAELIDAIERREQMLDDEDHERLLLYLREQLVTQIVIQAKGKIDPVWLYISNKTGKAYTSILYDFAKSEITGIYVPHKK